MKINRSVKRSIDILKLVSESKEGVSLGEIQSNLEIPKSSAFDIIQTLLATNMIDVLESDTKRYKIGLEAHIIGSNYKSDLIEISKEYLKKLADLLGKTVFLGILDSGEIKYLNKLEPERAVFTIARLGSKNPIHCTSLGKAIMAYKNVEEVKGILKSRGMKSFTKNTITDIETYLEELNNVRKKGYSIDDREVEEIMLCIGAPIFDTKGDAVAAISASGFFNGYDGIEKQGEYIKEAANKISKKLGYKM